MRANALTMPFEEELDIDKGSLYDTLSYAYMSLFNQWRNIEILLILVILEKYITFQIVFIVKTHVYLKPKYVFFVEKL